jgi:hypothetical protein
MLKELVRATSHGGTSWTCPGRITYHVADVAAGRIESAGSKAAAIGSSTILVTDDMIGP